VTTTRNHQQVVEIPQQIARIATFFNQASPAGPANSPLNGIFVEILEKFLFACFKAEPVQRPFRKVAPT